MLLGLFYISVVVDSEDHLSIGCVRDKGGQPVLIPLVRICKRYNVLLLKIKGAEMLGYSWTWGGDLGPEKEKYHFKAIKNTRMFGQNKNILYICKQKRLMVSHNEIS